MQRGQHFHHAANPCRKPADRREVQQKFRGANAPVQYQLQQLCIRNPISQKPLRQIGEVRHNIPLFPARAEVKIESDILLVNPAQPLLHSKYAKVLCQHAVLYAILHIFDLFEQLLLFPAVAVIPFIDIVIDHIAHNCRDNRCQNHNGVHLFEQRHIDHKPQTVLKQPG